MGYFIKGASPSPSKKEEENNTEIVYLQEVRRWQGI
jgi:hypothetical protein